VQKGSSGGNDQNNQQSQMSRNNTMTIVTYNQSDKRVSRKSRKDYNDLRYANAHQMSSQRHDSGRQNDFVLQRESMNFKKPIDPSYENYSNSNSLHHGGQDGGA
jgi:hypothetical protein